MIIKRDEKGRFMASETKKQKTSGGGWNTSRTRRFLQKRRVGDEEVKKSGFPVWTVNRKASR